MHTSSSLPSPESRAEVEFRRFVRAKSAHGISDGEAKLLSMLLRNFAEISSLGTAHGKRASWIVERWDSAESEDLAGLIGADSREDNQPFPIASLVGLEVGPFRGFVRSEEADLGKPVTFVYGPNGTGKSSLCEALEYAMLGFIEEAKAKRIHLQDYVRNVPSGGFEPPVLTVIRPNGDEEPASPDPTAYRFCFVDQNRIVAFARLAATTPAAQAQRLAALFGLEDFGQFVDGFTENFDRYLTLEPSIPGELEAKEAEISTHTDLLAREDNLRAEFTSKRQELTDRSGLKVDTDGLEAALHGEDDGEGRLAELDSLIEVQPTTNADPLRAFDRGQLREGLQAVEGALRKVDDLSDQLSERATDVGFAKLFEAVQGIRGEWRDESCPACLTPIGQVVRDPFERADQQLDSLSDLAETEDRLAEARRNLVRRTEAAVTLISVTNSVAVQLEMSPPLPELDDLLLNLAGGSQPDLDVLRARIAEIEPDDQRLVALEAKVEEELSNLESLEARRTAFRGERQLLREVAQELAALEAREAELDSAVASAKAVVAGFESLREELNRRIAREAEVIECHRDLFRAYSNVTGELGAYREVLPLVLVDELSDSALEIYNLINAHDPPFERLEGLALPKQAGEELLVKFSDGRDEWVNALQVLSEGHLRCLGVAILLAKNLHEECAILVFDDVVNAVDDDHRAGLADVLMEHPEVSKRQIVVTTHGKEFVKALSLRVTKAEFSHRVGQINFLVPRDVKGVAIDRHAEPSHYLVRSADAHRERRFRDALSDHRRALEATCEKLWKRLAAKYNAALTVQTRGLRLPPDLRSVVDSLSAFLRNTVSNSPDDVAADMAKQLGVITDRWEELNKGVHEEDEKGEFDPVLIGQLQAALDGLERNVRMRWKEL